MLVTIKEGEVSDRIKRNAELMGLSTDEYVEHCLEKFWDEFGYGVDQ